MSSGGYNLTAQRGNVETRIKGLVNNDLKEICKGYHLAVSGTKAVLQVRVIGVLNDIVAKGDVGRFEIFNHRVANHGIAPPPGQQANGVPRPNDMTLGYGRPAAPASASSRLSFKSSPFYEYLDTVLKTHDLPAGKEMPQNRHTVRAEIKLSEEHVRRLKDDGSLKILMYCGQTSSVSAYTAMDVAFPNQIEVKVNNDDVKNNFKGLKNKPGSTKPADITAHIRKVVGYSTPIHVCYALTSKKYAFDVRLVRHISADQLTQRIRSARVIPKQKVIEEMARANADPDISATSSKMSLKDPVSTMRISLPIRSTVCQHNQCFDGATFMQLQEQAPTWQCPICSKAVSFESLCVDKYFEEILAKTRDGIEQVTIEPDGQWRIETDDEDKGKSNQAKGEARAAYDDDFDDSFDDDFLEIVEPPAPRANGFKHPALAMETPPLSSREPSVAAQRPAAGSKRQPDVIDLTSDDDEPPRPAKRVTTGNYTGPATHSCNTPSSIPDPPRFPTYAQQSAESSALRMASPYSNQGGIRLPPIRPSTQSPARPFSTDFLIRPPSSSPFDRPPPTLPSFQQTQPASSGLRLPTSRPSNNASPDPFPGFRGDDNYYRGSR